MDYKTDYKFGTLISPVFTTTLNRLCFNKKVLDVGCGTGDYIQFFGKDSLGLDISPENIAEAKKRDLNVKSFDFNSPTNLDEKFDVAFCSQVLEHVESPIALLRFIYSSLNENGSLLISVPNEQSIIHLKYPYFTKNGNHLYSFSVNNLKELLLVAGFVPTEVIYDYYTIQTRKLKLDSVLCLLNYLPSILKNRLAWSYWIIATRSPIKNS